MIGEGTGIEFGFLAILIGGALAIWWRLEARFNLAHTSLKEHITKEVAKRELLADELANHKLHVERYFVSVQTLEKTETRLINAIDRLSIRLETMITRMEQFNGNDFRGGPKT